MERVPQRLLRLSRFFSRRFWAPNKALHGVSAIHTERQVMVSGLRVNKDGQETWWEEESMRRPGWATCPRQRQSSHQVPGMLFSVSGPICCHHPRDAKMPKPDENLDLGPVGSQPQTPHHKVQVASSPTPWHSLCEARRILYSISLSLESFGLTFGSWLTFGSSLTWPACAKEAT